MDAGARAVETNRELEAVDAERDEERAGAGGLHHYLFERLPLESRERLGHLVGAVGERTAARQPPERLQRGLLPLRPVDAADPAARNPELDQLLERLRVVVVELAVLDGGDEVGEPAAPLPVVHEGEHRLRLAERDLRRFAAKR